MLCVRKGRPDEKYKSETSGGGELEVEEIKGKTHFEGDRGGTRELILMLWMMGSEVP